MKRAVFAVAFLAFIAFLGLGSGFALYWRLSFIIMLALIGGLAWSWLNLRWLRVEMGRRASHGQVGTPLETRIAVFNQARWPRSWLEVEELTDLPQAGSGRVISLSGKKSRTWRHTVACRQRGAFFLGPVRVSSGDPFGLFRLHRDFLERHRLVVYPRIETLPDFNLPIAALPSDGRLSQRSPHVTSQAASVRAYVQGDSLKRVHWPYTARMGSLMVKEFDEGISSSVWLMVDLHRQVQVGEGLDGTEEVAITAAASIASRLLVQGVPVGLAGNGDRDYLVRPSDDQDQLEQLLEVLAMMRAHGSDPLDRALYQLEPHLSSLNTVVLITPSNHTDWMVPLSDLRRRGIYSSAVLLDAASFGSSSGQGMPLDILRTHDIPGYVVQRGQPLNEALREPASPAMHRVPTRMVMGSPR